ncbi:hypothetical protein [Caballeronia sp. ATUFL_M2_KS44]|uniref:hypothetical protein n=1 Tax=Caballeronia sp. ATUFL_M2_KS44 TaxID=2921767 RepID=UPI002027F8E8|nr:hypothetical protein [Caballeronia sp. ATUFL_M2_KS44]
MITVEQAMAARRSGLTPKGTTQADGLVMVEITDDTGRRIREFYGQPGMWMDAFKSKMGLMVKLDKECAGPQNFSSSVPKVMR